MLAEFSYIRIEQLEHYELNPIPAALNAIRVPINTIECIKFFRLRLPNKLVEFFKLRNTLDAMPSSSTWKTIESAIQTWIQSFKATMDKISDIQWREDDEPEFNSKTSQFSNPPNYKVNVSNATISQDHNLPGPDKSNANHDAQPNSNKNSSVNAFTTLPGYTQNQSDYQMVSLLCNFWDGYACSYKGSNNKPCDRRHQLGIDQRP